MFQAVQAYATDSAGFTRSKVCFSDNWFQSRRWQAHVDKQAEDREKTAALQADHHARLTSGRSLNIAPPGYEKAFDSLRDVMNQRHGWADPMELERTQEVRDTIETPTRAQGRDELHAWLQTRSALA